MEDKPRRYPKNVDGPFFVEDDMCMVCGAPEFEAPDLIEHDTENSGHCYFKKQPSTPDEVERACRAHWASCCGALHYAGDDPKVLQRLAEVYDEQNRKAAERLAKHRKG